jgi:putative salt-induced outer membrane protein
MPIATVLAAALLAAHDPAPPPADPATISPELRAMLDAAIASGSETDVAVIVKYALASKAPGADAVAQIATEWRQQRQRDAAERLANASFFGLMKGRVEVGGFVTTGNSRNLGASVLADLTREGPQWRHKAKLMAEYQESGGVPTREHYLAAYEPNLKIDERLYTYGALQYESDKFLGYTDRYSASAGAGYSAIRGPQITLDLEVGPAFRDTAFTDATRQREIAARGSVDLDWKLSSGLTLRQDASAYVQSTNSTVSSTTAIAAKLIGPLSAQLSYALQYESQPPIGRLNTDTTSRASLVYAF